MQDLQEKSDERHKEVMKKIDANRPQT